MGCELTEARESFAEALERHMRAFGDTATGLEAVIPWAKAATIQVWRRGVCLPAAPRSMAVVRGLEARYGIHPEQWVELIRSDRIAPPAPRRRYPTPPRRPLDSISQATLAWHTPPDLEQRSDEEREAFTAWLLLTFDPAWGSSDPMRRRPKFATFDLRGATRFLALPNRRETAGRWSLNQPIRCPDRLAAEWNALVDFHTRRFTPIGRKRSVTWARATVRKRAGAFGVMFGYLAAVPQDGTPGEGVAEALSLGLLVFPAVWDRFIGWMENRRGYIAEAEVALIQMARALTDPRTGWLRQSLEIRENLQPIEGLVSARDIALAVGDWDKACDRCFEYAFYRSKDMKRLIVAGTSVYSAVKTVLESDDPLTVYGRIPNEILRWRPDPKADPAGAARSTQLFLMFRLAMHTGFRQRNLRELLICPPGQAPTSERELFKRGRGELRWRSERGVWEISAPPTAFKNGSAAYFRYGSFSLALPDVGGLYEALDRYVAVERAVIIDGMADPGTCFVHIARHRAVELADCVFYDTWRNAVSKYGVYNPWTRRGAVEGLLPHGPHTVRAVVATQVLKKTGSFELAGYAIQDSRLTVEKYYGVFQPNDRLALVAAHITAAVSHSADQHASEAPNVAPYHQTPRDERPPIRFHGRLATLRRFRLA